MTQHNSAMLYETLSHIEKDARIAEIYHRMVGVELKHAEKWETELKEGGEGVPQFKPVFKTQLMIRLAKVGPLKRDFIRDAVDGTERVGFV